MPSRRPGAESGAESLYALLHMGGSGWDMGQTSKMTTDDYEDGESPPLPNLSFHGHALWTDTLSQLPHPPSGCGPGEPAARAAVISARSGLSRRRALLCNPVHLRNDDDTWPCTN